MTTAEPHQPQPAASTPRRWLAAATVLGAVAVTAVIGVAAMPGRSNVGHPTPGTPSDQPSAAGSDVSPSVRDTNWGRPCQHGNTGSAALTHPARDAAASDWLRLAAATIGTAEVDTQSGALVYVRLHQWFGDTTVGADNVGRTTQRVFIEESWYADDGSATTITSAFPPGTASPGPGVPGAELRREEQRAGTWHNRFPGQPSSDPPTLAGQLDQVQPGRVGAQARMRALGSIAREYTLPCGVRVAALLVLAQAPAVWRGEATDKAGRTGVAISIDSTDGITRDTLILDPATGVLLTHEETVLRNPGRLAGPFPQLRSSVAFIETGRRATITPHAR